MIIKVNLTIDTEFELPPGQIADVAYGMNEFCSKLEDFLPPDKSRTITYQMFVDDVKYVPGY